MPSIILNGRLTDAPERASYADLVALAGRDPAIVHAITFCSSPKGGFIRSGSVTRGQVLTLDEGMVVSVMDPSRA
jgi:hypothetical protein